MEECTTGVVLKVVGNRKICIESPDGQHSVSILADVGRHGLGFTIRHRFGSTPLTVRPYDQNYQDMTPALDDVQELAITCYNANEEAQAFKRWYGHQETESDLQVLGPKYRRGHRHDAQQQAREQASLGNPVKPGRG